MLTDSDLQALQDKSTATFSAKVLADSVNPWGDRLTTFELIYPRCIHSEIMTHRLFSRNAASSRAIPLEKSIKAVEETPFIPFHWGKNQSGMQAYAEKTGWDKSACRATWYGASRQAVTAAYRLRYLELHKQIANRILEPFMFISVVLSTTSFRHFELLRNHEAAEPHLQHLAKLMASARSESLPEALKPGEWHLPLIYDEDRSKLNLSDLKKVSTARCAAVSYVRHNEVKDYEKDFALYERLTTGGHWSPLEHLATPYGKSTPYASWAGGLYFHNITTESEQCGNFKGWKQHRKEFETEFVPDEPYTGPTR